MRSKKEIARRKTIIPATKAVVMHMCVAMATAHSRQDESEHGVVATASLPSLPINSGAGE